VAAALFAIAVAVLAWPAIAALARLTAARLWPVRRR